MKTKGRPHGDATACVHAGEDRHGRKAALTTEISQTSVFVLPKLEDLKRIAEKKESGYMYTRYANPTTAAAEQKIAALEGGDGCVVTASGMAAILVTFLALCASGDEIVSMLDIYGGTLKLMRKVLPRLGITTKFVPYHEIDRIEKHLSKKTKLLFLETPTNPTLRIVDLERMAAIARKRGIVTVVDNTFATPILQKPLALGCDVSLHSATKYLGGHSDVTAGAIVGDRDFIAVARDMMLTSGGSLDPGASYLLIRGLKTLELRVARACRNAQMIAGGLEQNKKVARVMYPGLRTHAGHAVARKQMSDFGMMLSFEFGGGERAAHRFIDALKLWYLAPSLGGVESTVSYPLYSSHFGMPTDEQKLFDVSPATIRLSVGIEDPEDLLDDLEQALARA
jgi:cystathionine beta-lyase/cystathionine gamma-synthase